MEKSLDKMDKDELRDALKGAKSMVKDIEKAIAGFDDRRKAEVRADLESKAKEAGFSLDDFLGGKSRGGRGAKRGDPKYRHPANEAITWTGKGRQPAWFKEHVEAGGDPEELGL